MAKAVRSLFGIIIPLITICALIGLLAFSLIRLSNVERNMRIGVIPNMLWVISKTHISSMNFVSDLKSYDAGEISQDDLRLSFNILKSRVALLNDNPQKQILADLGFSKDLGQITQNLPLIKHFIDDENLDKDNIKQVLSIVAPFNKMLNNAATEAMINEWDTLGDQLDQSKHQISQIVISLIGISLAGGILSIHFLLIVRDKKRRARLLDKEKALSKILISSSDEGIIAVDLNGICNVWNQAAAKLFGQIAEQALNQPIDKINRFFRSQSVSHAINKSLNGQPTVLLDQPLLTDNESHYLDLRCLPLKDGKQQIGIILLITDVTHHRAVQREVAMHRDHLEEVVKKRTQKLQDALEREQETAYLFRNFGVMVSYQFSRPLANIDENLQQLILSSDNLKPDQIIKYCTAAKSTIDRLNKLITSTLNTAHMDAEKIQLNNEYFDLNALIQNINEQAHELSNEQKSTINTSDNGIVMVYGDITQVEYILLNLLSNAIKFSPAGSAINIDLTGTSENIKCTVSNKNSGGITLNENMLFRRYYRGENADESADVGLGLYMSRALARMQKGDLYIDQSEKEIFKFVLVLPRKITTETNYTRQLTETKI